MATVVGTQGERRRRIRQRLGQGNVPPKISRMHRPAGMSLEAWQTQLRRQFGSQQDFGCRNLGEEPFFSDFEVTNPASKATYRVAIRGEGPGDNYCTCPDFATNTLGTCKHIEHVLARLRRKRGGAKALAQRYQPPYSEVYLSYGGAREVRFRAGSDCPGALVRLAQRYFDDEGRLLPAALPRFDAFLREAGKLEHELRAYDDALEFVAQMRDAERREALLKEAFPRGIRSAAFNKLLKLPLYDYQREGALFVARAGRALLGDEMGLGKTVQALAAAEIMARLYGVERVLVVCPTSLKHQWEREIARLTHRDAQVVAGLRPAREKTFTAPSFFKITNYDTLHRDLELIQHWSPDLVILDEAQRIKNWQTRAARAVKKIASPYALVLTGTPLENRLEELVSIVQFVDQHRLGPTFRFLERHQVREEGTARVVGYRHLDQITQTLAPILIRRRKDQVLNQLPERLEKNFFVPMTPQQMLHHDENREVVARIVAKWRRYKFLSEADQRRLLIALQNMRMACDSTYLLDQQTDWGVKAGELATLLDEIYEQPEAKVVIFSQWLRMHELLVRRFQQQRWGHVLFHGGVPGPQRRGLVNRFREDPSCRAFLSTDAGGVGLNLQHANVVVNMDLPWNPAVLEQRIGRVHRLGQTRPVQVVNFVAQGTIEEGMLGLIGFKKSLFSGVLDGGQPEVFLGGSRLKRFLESVDHVTSHIPASAGEDLACVEAARSVVTDDEAEAAPAEPRGAAEAAPAAPPQPATADSDPWAGLVQQGLSLLGQLAAASRGALPESAAGLRVDRDENTGQRYLKLALPEPRVVEQLLSAVQALLGGLRA